MLLFSALQIPIVVLAPLLTTFLSKYVVELVIQEVSINTLISHILIIPIVALLLQLANKYMSTAIQWRSFGNRFKFMDIYIQKFMKLDYELLEEPDGQNRSQKAQNAILGDADITQQIFSQCISILSNVIGLISYSLILLSFDSLIVIILLLVTITNYYLNKCNNTWNHKNKDKWIATDRKLLYIKRKAADFDIAKDIKLFGMSKWFDRLFNKFLAERTHWWKASEKHGVLLDLFIALTNLLREGIVYIILIYQTTTGGLSISDFVFYFGIVAQYSGWLLGIISAYASLHQTSLGIRDLREFLDMQDKFNHGFGKALPTDAPEIEFRNVSFKYPGSNSYTLNNINVVIHKNVKIALVGLNGAGKTTFVKLLCGLYMPTSGEIRINGKNLLEYNIDEYYSILSAVFQDIYLLPVSVEKNIALCEDNKIDRTKIDTVLKLSGLYNKIQSLPKKEKTPLLKTIHSDAIDLSGGEKQKLALARALYKNGLVTILDEPTAALDPIAEYEVYSQFNDIVTNKTVIYISHRLASCRFCDRIAVFDNGQLIQLGKHTDLLSNTQGKYYDLWNVQAQYYT